MLEQMRRQGASVFVYLIFGLLIVIFVINFAPSGNRGSGGCSTSSNTVVTVDGVDANNSAFLVAYSSPTNTASSRQKTYLALDYVIRQELLAQAAQARGIRTTGDLIDDQIIQRKRGYFYIGGQRLDATSQFFDESGNFNIKRWKGWISSLNIQSPGTYREEQARGLQAAMYSDLITHSVRVSRDEALADYLYDQNTVTYDVVAFDPTKFRPALKVTEADLKRYAEGHTAELEAKYKAEASLYKGVKPELQIREIFIPKAFDTKPPEPPKDPKAAPADAKKPEKVYGLPIEAAKAKLEAVRAQIAAGKLKFEDAEKQLAADASDDAPAQNGDRGWKKADDAQLGDKAINDAVKTLKPGEMTPVVVGDRGVILAIALAKREGDLTFDQVKLEIAEKDAKEAWSKEAAKRAALETLAQAQAGTGKNLDQMFERELVKPSGNGLEELLNNPDLTPEQRQQIEKLLQQQSQLPKHGALETHEVDVPVAWYADADGSSGSAAPAAGSAVPTAGTATVPTAGSATVPTAGTATVPTAGSATVPTAGTATVPTAGSATVPTAGSATVPTAGSATVPTAGSATVPAAGAPAAAAPAAPSVVVASKDVLPALGEVPKAKVNRLGPTPRQAKLPGIGGSKAAINALFDELAPGNLAKQVYEGEGGTYLVIQLINKATPKVEDFDKTADAEIARMTEARGRAAVHEWLKGRCETLTKANKIRPAPERIRETDDKGNPAPTVYRPCMYLDIIDR
jgi:hypothetical protein